MEELRSEAKEYISEWTTRKDVSPPFTCKQLIMLAIAIHGSPLSSQDIFLWICTTFAFYRSIGPTAVWSYLLVNDTESTKCMPFRYPHGRILPSGFQRARQLYQFPAEIEINQVAFERPVDGNVLMPLLESNPTSILLYLRSQKKNHHEPAGSFAFLRLPAELRNEIYKLVLTFPRSGVQIGRHEQDPSGMVYLAPREFGRAADDDDDNNDDDKIENNEHDDGLSWNRRRDICAGRMSHLLSLLLVNQQICSEAFYIFAAVNTFYFTSASHMVFILRRMSPQYRDQIPSLAFHHKPELSCARRLKTAFEIMAEMKRLRILSIYLNQREFRQYYSFYPEKSIAELTGLETRPELNDSLSIKVYGDFPRTVAEIMITSD